MKTRLKIPDILIILLVTGFTIFSGYNAYMKPQGKPQVLIRGQCSEWLFPIDASEIIIVSGPLGDTTVRIGENGAWVEGSPCDNKTCVASGLLVRQGQWAACLPNNVLLMIQGGASKKVSRRGGDVDAVAW